MFTAETRRSPRKIFSDPIVRGDWIRNVILSGLRSESFHGHGIVQEPCPKRTEAFLFGGISPPNKKVFLCVLSASAVRVLFLTRFSQLPVHGKTETPLRDRSFWSWREKDNQRQVPASVESSAQAPSSEDRRQIFPRSPS